MCIRSHIPNRSNEGGLSLIELVMFIVIVSVAVGGVLHLMNLNAGRSVDPLLHKQGLAIAEALLEEIEQMPFTDCDPDGYDATSLPTPTCIRNETIGPETAYANQSMDETRGGPSPFDNVNDYNGLTLTGGATDVGGVVVLPDGYSASITVSPDDKLGPSALPLADTEVLLIAVAVSYRGTDIVTVEGYRTKYVPTP